MKLLRYWGKGVELIFIDEASVNTWTKTGKVWVPADRPFSMMLVPSRGENVQLQGAISNRQREFRWHVATEGNDTWSFLDFLQSIEGWPLDP